jgi:hypothetical protein
MTILADVFISPARSVIIHTTPGREVKFFGGNAKITDHRDMPFMLGLDNARVIPTRDACAWADDWLNHTREIKAQVDWPEGWEVEFTNQDQWTIVKPPDEISVTRLPEAVSSTEPAKEPDWNPFSSGASLVDQLLTPE